MQDSVLKINEFSGNILSVENEEFDTGKTIAYRTKLKEISVKTFWLSGVITIGFGFLLMIINSIYFEEIFTYIACGILCIVGLVLIIESPIANNRNALVRKINSYPDSAITYADKKFYIITDRVHEIALKDIQKVEYTNLQIYKTAWTSLATAGVVRIKTTRGVAQVYQVAHAPQAVKSIKHIINTHQKKMVNKR